MDSSINNGMCRCCAAENTFKDLHTTYQWMGDEEIYSTMLRDCFNVDLITSEEGNGGICEVCITQLRNAANFKKQVLHTEEQFRRHLQDKPFKTTIVNIVKQEYEKQDVSDDDSDRNMSDDFSPDFEIPIKQEPVEVEPKTKSKKRAASVKATATVTKAKKAKIEVGESSTRRTSVGAKIKTDPTETKPVRAVRQSKNVSYQNETNLSEITKNRFNLTYVLLHSNANPIRRKTDLGYSCSFCRKDLPSPIKLKTHFIEEHNNHSLIKSSAGKLFEHVVKLDITKLICNICNEHIPNLDDFISHLKTKHGKKVFPDVKNMILPFKFDSEELRCAVCFVRFHKFKLLQQHMHVHFENYICEVCGTGFVNESLLTRHVKQHSDKKYKCKVCGKVYRSERILDLHNSKTHLRVEKRNKCGYCEARFSTYSAKMNHLMKEHGVVQTVMDCQSCDKTFVTRRALTRHMKRDHLMERNYKCSYCSMQFFTKWLLQNHLTKHTGARNYKCEVCQKAYTTKNTLREHLRIHANDRKYKCERCDQAFVQKCSWRGHMKNKHGEIV